eukprot:4109370-Pleurochrysis_carterae.AAC.5
MENAPSERRCLQSSGGCRAFGKAVGVWNLCSSPPPSSSLASLDVSLGDTRTAKAGEKKRH